MASWAPTVLRPYPLFATDPISCVLSSPASSRRKSGDASCQMVRHQNVETPRPSACQSDGCLRLTDRAIFSLARFGVFVLCVRNLAVGL